MMKSTDPNVFGWLAGWCRSHHHHGDDDDSLLMPVSFLPLVGVVITHQAAAAANGGKNLLPETSTVKAINGKIRGNHMSFPA